MIAITDCRVFLRLSTLAVVVVVVVSIGLPCVSSHPLFAKSKIQRSSLGSSRIGSSDTIIPDSSTGSDIGRDEVSVLNQNNLHQYRRQQQKLLLNADQHSSVDGGGDGDHDNLVLMMNASRRLLENKLDDGGINNSESNRHKLRLKFRRLRVRLC